MMKSVERTVIKITVPFLDAANCAEVDEKYEQFLETIKDPSYLPIDFGKVTYISSAIGILLYSMHESFEHTIRFMRVQSKIMKVIELCEWHKIPNFEFMNAGVCPYCQKIGFNYDTYSCIKCGHFNTVEIP